MKHTGNISIDDKREREKQLVSEMIALYCRKIHGSKDSLCSECSTLNEYAHSRSDKCPFMDNKTFCSNCKVHCYSPVMREQICKVMKYSGPRMIFHHPIIAMRHVAETRREAARIKKENQKINGAQHGKNKDF